MDTSVFKKIIVTGAIIAIAACGFFIFSLMLLYDYRWQFDTDYMPGIVMGAVCVCLLSVLSVFIATSFAKASKVFQDEISYLRNRIVELEKKVDKK